MESQLKGQIQSHIRFSHHPIFYVHESDTSHSLTGCSSLDLVISGGGLRGYYVTGASLVLAEFCRLKNVEVWFTMHERECLFTILCFVLFCFANIVSRGWSNSQITRIAGASAGAW